MTLFVGLNLCPGDDLNDALLPMDTAYRIALAQAALAQAPPRPSR